MGWGYFVVEEGWGWEVGECLVVGCEGVEKEGVSGGEVSPG